MSRYSNPSTDKAFSFPAQLDPKVKPVDYLAYMKDEILEKMNSTFETSFTKDVLEKLRENPHMVLTDKQLLSLRRMVDKYKVAEHIKEGYLFAGYAGATSIAKPAPSSKMKQANDDTDDYDDDIPF